MISFIDGPAADINLQLRRAPRLLRVVFDPKGKTWDALDQLEDKPTRSEQVTVYEVAPHTLSRYHLCVRGKGRAASGWYWAGLYFQCHEQPIGDEAQNAWATWALKFASEHAEPRGVNDYDLAAITLYNTRELRKQRGAGS